jgi:hypothetical protein
MNLDRTDMTFEPRFSAKIVPGATVGRGAA